MATWSLTNGKTMTDEWEMMFDAVRNDLIRFSPDRRHVEEIEVFRSRRGSLCIWANMMEAAHPVSDDVTVCHWCPMRGKCVIKGEISVEEAYDALDKVYDHMDSGPADCFAEDTMPEVLAEIDKALY